ncbi:MAG: inositol monophosphatase family protein [Planctomycetia bacterium]|nr:inositol monophosphatase family protein [Planctomycetia bacterium]
MSRMSLAIEIAQEAGAFTCEYFNNPALAIERKSDGTPVTAADKGAEELLRRRIEEQFPDDAILGEEFPAKQGTSGYRWILDPIDGTKSFIHGVPIYSTLVGVEKDGDPFAGVIWIPALNEGIWAEKGEGAWWSHPKLPRPVRARVSEIDSFDEALFLTSEARTFAETNRWPAYELFEKSCRLTRTWGDAYGYYLVATGRAEIILDPALGDWDAGPLLTVLEEAGGHFTDWNGTPTIYNKEGLATNHALFQKTLDLVSPFRK